MPNNPESSVDPYGWFNPILIDSDCNNEDNSTNNNKETTGIQQIYFVSLSTLNKLEQDAEDSKEV
jgi:hypothetical protein